MSRDASFYSVKCLFRHALRDGEHARYSYEERITLWLVESEEEALRLSEAEAHAYVSSNNALSPCPIEFMGYQMCYSTQESAFENGLEIYSLLRDSNLDPAAYMDRFYDTGAERCKHEPEQ